MAADVQKDRVPTRHIAVAPCQPILVVHPSDDCRHSAIAPLG